MKNKNIECPKFAWIIMLCLGCLDIIRGIMHTILIEYAAPNIMGLDLSFARDDQLLLMGSFGISNYITGIMQIIITLKARNIVEPTFLVIPSSYLFGSIFRIRSKTSEAIHRFYQDKGYCYVHTPIITGSDCEGAGETFGITPEDFFGREVSLTVSGQLHGETAMMGLGQIYTFGPTFRAEMWC